MNNYRSEIRIFGLLIFALIATALLGVGLSDVQGDLFGVKFSVVGPIGGFVVLILIFHLTGLFVQGLPTKEQDILSHPVEKLSADELADMIDELDKRSKKIERRINQLKDARDAKESGSTDEEILEASGMTMVHRPSS